MTEKMEKAMEDLGRALDRLCDVVEGSDGARLMLALDVNELMDAIIPRNKYYILGRIAEMIEALWRSEYVTEQANAAMAALHRVRMEKYAEKTQFLTLWEESKNKTTTLRKNDIMAILVYPDELHDYDKTTIDMIQDVVIQKEKESCEEEPDIDVKMHFKDGSVVKAYTDEDGRMIFKPQRREV